MTYGPYDFMVDFAIASVFMIIGQILRARIKLFQSLYIPASVIAGILCLLLGPQFANILPFTSNISSYPYLLIVFLFAGQFLGNTHINSVKQMANKAGDMFFYNACAQIGQYGLVMLFGLLVLGTLFPNLNKAFAVMLPAGFSGGHGTAAAFGGIFSEYGFTDATSLGMTTATFGLLIAIFGGIILINIATRIGATQYVKKMADAPESMRTGLMPPEERQPIGFGTVSPSSIDPIAWHVALCLLCTMAAYYINGWFKARFGVDVPMMSISMLCGILIQLFLNQIKMGDYIDKETTTRIGSAASDYMVVFGIASIQISVIITYAVPLLLTVLFGIVLCLIFIWVISPRVWKDAWFEHAIFSWGWLTGTVSCGVTLLRVIDPEFKSGTLEDYGLSYAFQSIYETVMLALLPLFLGLGFYWQSTAILLAIAALAFFCLVKLGYWHESYLKVSKGRKE